MKNEMEVRNEVYTGPWDEEMDVVIAGGGGAGLEAALEAVNAGADTIVFEKQYRLWDSSTAASAGMISFAGTDIQKKQGIRDSNDLLYEDIMNVGKWKNDSKLVRAYVDNQLDTYNQLTELGIEWSDFVAAGAGMSVPRLHLTDSFDLVRALKRAVQAKGARVFPQIPVIGLLVDEEKSVIGVNIQERTGATTRIRARKGVVLATGGFARDSERLSRINPRFSNVRATSGVGHTGDGLKMAEELGAYMKDVEHVKPSFELHVNDPLATDITFLYFLGGIIVDKRGKRFVNESISYKDIGMICLEQPDAIGYQIFDQKIYELAVEERKKSGVDFPLGLDETKIRLLVKGNTIEELARDIGLPPQTLKETVDKYNSYVNSGKDLDFGRTTLSADYGSIVKIDRPPFYSFETVCHFLSTYAGVAVDEDMHVLTKEGKILGLYAAGEVVGGFHGESYQSGTALGKALIFGRIAGRNVAKVL